MDTGGHKPYRRKEGKLRAVGGMRNRKQKQLLSDDLQEADLKELWWAKAVMWAGEQRGEERAHR